MPKSERRHLLAVYKYMLDRWWRDTLALGVALIILAGGLGGLPLLLPQYSFMWVDDLTLWIVAGVGAFTIFFSIFLISIRKSAYVQPFADHLRLVTPFLRLNISYRRFRRTYTAEMQRLFPANKVSNWRRELLRPLANETVVVIELTGFPVSLPAMRLFLSPLFFPDKTPRLAILVPDWLAFSTDLESLRGSWRDAQRQATSDPRANLLSSLSKK